MFGWTTYEKIVYFTLGSIIVGGISLMIGIRVFNIGPIKGLAIIKEVDSFEGYSVPSEIDLKNNSIQKVSALFADANAEYEKKPTAEETPVQEKLSTPFACKLSNKELVDCVVEMMPLVSSKKIFSKEDYAKKHEEIKFEKDLKKVANFIFKINLLKDSFAKLNWSGDQSIEIVSKEVNNQTLAVVNQYFGVQNQKYLGSFREYFAKAAEYLPVGTTDPLKIFSKNVECNFKDEDSTNKKCQIDDFLGEVESNDIPSKFKGSIERPKKLITNKYYLITLENEVDLSNDASNWSTSNLWINRTEELSANQVRLKVKFENLIKVKRAEFLQKQILFLLN